MRLTQHRRAGFAVAAVLLAGVVAAAGVALSGTNADEASDPGTGAGGTPLAPATSEVGPPVIVPGRPGESAAVSTDGRPVEPVHNPQEVTFVRMMIPHHTQALRMAAMAPDRAGDPRIRALAERVRVSQLPEIQRMRGWLAENRLPPDAPGGGHDHRDMPGMQSDAALRALAQARGADFDRLFVEMMTDHHQGAIEMATGVLRVGVDVTVRQLATSIATEQGAEIGRMRDLAVT
ncbi:DUF305 domain-containing protein [Solwaraspora sp. WMMD1047]|uniref:DUF305 domain-containing protein n=1 Tax=Solwaraspora sp. WMMD1047 TaxID=3016102 RepID=UPI00241804EB|nr:DUF305 domain-containing protein [Solwaraspora sp. WMMD1047]MDG4831259.1 DUF305 domain-containing protein [Solwaraspora sp. WMMD1047]